MSKIMGAVLAATMLSAGAAGAATPAGPAYEDLDLGRPADARIYSARIDRAADRACERTGTGFGSGREMFECRVHTRATLTAALPAEVRSVYEAALKGQPSDALTRARLAAGAPGAVNRD